MLFRIYWPGELIFLGSVAIGFSTAYLYIALGKYLPYTAASEVYSLILHQHGYYIFQGRDSALEAIPQAAHIFSNQALNSRKVLYCHYNILYSLLMPCYTQTLYQSVSSGRQTYLARMPV